MVNRNKRGFTLIEILVAISIVAVLSAVSLSALGGTRKVSRDGKRKADMEQVRSALEIYRSDCSAYPTALPTPGGSLTASCPNLGTYLSAMPDDPIPGTYKYSYNRTGVNTYNLCAHLEIGGASELSGCAAGSCTGVCNYKQGNP